MPRDPDEPCKHGLHLTECTYCTGPEDAYLSSRMVHTTSYGKEYHARADCPRLLYGQELVRQKGGTPSPVEMVSEDSVKFDKSPCPQCFPKSRKT